MLGLTLGLLLTLVGSRAQDSPPSEYQVKAAFIFNFAKFVEWPADAFADAKSPLVIGVLGENPFGPDLERTVRDKTVNERPIAVKECQTLDEARKCHIVFISNSEKNRLKEISDGLRGARALTVGESEGFTEAGGIINFVLESNKIRFQINDDTAKAAGLKISSKLLSLAVRPAR